MAEMTRLQRFQELNRIVHEHIGSFMEAGKALAEIKAKRLWAEAGHASWREFIDDEHPSIGGRHADRIVSACQITSETGPRGPSTERQARELGRIKDPEQRGNVWDDMLKEKDGEQPTAAEVKQRVDDIEAQQSDSVSDALGRPVTASNLKPMFARLDEYKSLLKDALALRRNVKGVFKDNPYLHHGTKADLDNIVEAVRFAAPHTVCPYCQGGDGEGCPKCRHTGWMPKQVYETLPEEIRQQHEGG
jgi:hypothetical protein